jgi:hypothetical protein
VPAKEDRGTNQVGGNHGDPDIQGVSTIKDGDDEHLMNYYLMLQSHIEEARIANLLGMLLIPANTEVMVRPLPT